MDRFGGHDHAGIKIGHGAVIGSRALVAKDVEPYTIVGETLQSRLGSAFLKKKFLCF